MRLPLLALILASCAATPDPSPPAPAAVGSPAAVPPAVPPAADPVPAPPAQSIASPKPVRTTISGISIDALVFDSRTHHLAVADQPGGPGSKWSDARDAGASGIAAINGGFFTPEGAPLGRLVADGTAAGSANNSSLGAGYYVRHSTGKMDLVRRSTYVPGRQALQSGPFLIENRRAVGGLSTKRSTARSFVATDGGHRWIIARTGPCSLAELAVALASNRIGGIAPKSVLNLDGGRSSEIWVSSQVEGGPFFQRPLWNKPVRNFLIVRKNR